MKSTWTINDLKNSPVANLKIMKNKPHTIELKELQEWLKDAELLFASSSRERKRLVVTASGGFIVYVAGEIRWQGVQPFSAIEAYNEITEKYVEEKIDFIL